MKDELKRCPFCGGKAVVVPPARDLAGCDYTTSHVTCENCDTHGPDQLLEQGGDWQACVDAAIIAWNQRSTDTALPVNEEAVAWLHNLTGIIRTDKPHLGLHEDYTPLYTRSRTGGREAGELAIWANEVLVAFDKSDKLALANAVAGLRSALPQHQKAEPVSDVTGRPYHGDIDGDGWL